MFWMKAAGPTLGVHADDDAEGGEEREPEPQRDDQHDRLAHRHVDDGVATRAARRDQQRPHHAAERQAEVDLPGRIGEARMSLR